MRDLETGIYIKANLSYIKALTVDALLWNQCLFSQNPNKNMKCWCKIHTEDSNTCLIFTFIK